MALLICLLWQVRGGQEGQGKSGEVERPGKSGRPEEAKGYQRGQGRSGDIREGKGISEEVRKNQGMSGETKGDQGRQMEVKEIERLGQVRGSQGRP